MSSLKCEVCSSDELKDGMASIKLQFPNYNSVPPCGPKAQLLDCPDGYQAGCLTQTKGVYMTILKPLDWLINALEPHLERVQEVLQPRLRPLSLPKKTEKKRSSRLYGFCLVATSLLSCVVLFDDPKRNCLFFLTAVLGSVLNV